MMSAIMPSVRALEPADNAFPVMPAVTAYQHITVAQKHGLRVTSAVPPSITSQMPEAFGNLLTALQGRRNKRAEAQVLAVGGGAKVMCQHAGPLDTWITLQHDQDGSSGQRCS
jgi:hypothetical protein